MLPRVSLAFLVASVAVCAACGSFGTAPSPVEADGGSDGSAPTSDASFDASSDASDASSLPECGTPLVTDPSVATDCPGSSAKLYLATDSANCGRCGYSCGSERCEDGLCVAKQEAMDIEALLGISNGMALASTKSQIRGYTAGSAQPLANLTNDVPVNAVISKTELFFRTNGTLRTAGGASFAIAGNAPFLAPSAAGVVTSGNGNLLEGTSSPAPLNSLVNIPSPREIVAVGSNYVVHSATSSPSLRLVSGVGGTNPAVTELVPNVGKISELQAFSDYAYYVRANQVLRVDSKGGVPELVSTSPREIRAYQGGPALAVTADAIRYIGAIDAASFELYEQEQCPGAQPRLVAKLENSKGVLVTPERVYWSNSTNQLFSRAIAKKR